MSSGQWLLLVTSLPGLQGAERLRLWRRLRRLGAAVLRDGVYLLPRRPETASTLPPLADELTRHGTAYLFDATIAEDAEPALHALFARTSEYAAGLAEVKQLTQRLGSLPEPAAQRALRSLRRRHAALAAIDWFPGAGLAEWEQALIAAEQALRRAYGGSEPAPRAGPIERLERADFSQRHWATRAGLWVDRVASAWLIQRWIDPQAQFLWLADPAHCPHDAVGFDFDGARFSHVGALVSFEVLAASFGLDADPALARLGRLVRYLDVGGTVVPEAAGFKAVLAGARAECADDDALLARMSPVLDALYTAYRI